MLFVNRQLKKNLPIDILKQLRQFLRKILISFLNQNIYLEYCQEKPEENCSTLDFNSEEIIKVEGFFTLDKIPDKIQQRSGVFRINKPFVFELNNVELTGPYATGFSSNGNIIVETTVPSFYGLEQGVPLRSLAAKKFTSSSTIKLEVAASLVNVWCHNYFHWLIDCLARVEGIQYYQQQTGIKPKLIISSNPSSWQEESLNLLGYKLEDCFCWNTSRIQVKKLVVPSFRRNSLSEISPTACRWLRQRILSNLPTAASSKCYFSPRVLISRGKATGRRVINEDELIEALAPLGFVVYTLEEMSFSDQVRLFSQAKVILGPHGAGLVNMIFSQNLTVIELLGEPINPIFYTLSQALDFKYGFIQCKTIRKRFNSTRNDIIVEISELKELLTRMLGNSN